MELAIAVSLCLPLILWFACWLAMPNQSYAMDPGNSRGMFLGIAPLYHRLFYTNNITAFVSLFAAAYLHANMALLPLLASMIYGAAFIGFTAFFYEGYLHNQASYTLTKYAIVLSLGFTSFTLFIVGEVSMLFALAEYGRRL